MAEPAARSIEMTASITNKKLIVALLLMASSVGAMSTDLYAPSLPHLPEYFDTTTAMVQLTLFVNAVAFGVMQLLLGPLSDRVGRRPVFLFGVILFALFSAACALSGSIHQLIGARTLQGAAGSVEAVITLAVLTDLFEEKQRIKVLAIYGMLFAFTPAVAPILGGYIHVWLGWQANFWLLASLGALLSLAIWRFMPETAPQKHKLNLPLLAKNYWRLLRNREFLLLCLTMGMIVGGLFAFIASSPFVIIDHYGVATQHFGFYQMGILCVYILGSYLSAKLVDRLGSAYLLRAGLSILVLGAVLLMVFEYLLTPSLTGYVIGISVVLFALGPLWAVLPSITLDKADGGMGTASALFGAIEMMGAGIGVALLAAIDLPGSQPATICLMVLSLAVIGFYLWSRRV